jgi:hypothetical protein
MSLTLAQYMTSQCISNPLEVEVANQTSPSSQTLHRNECTVIPEWEISMCFPLGGDMWCRLSRHV